MYQIQTQYIIGNNQIWVLQLAPNDPIYQYDDIEQANTKLSELQTNDSSGRQYRIVEI